MRPFTHGLHDLGKGCFAWLQPDGGWGFSNSGLIADGGEIGWVAKLQLDPTLETAIFATPVGDSSPSLGRMMRPVSSALPITSGRRSAGAL